ncbi:MAG TPA: hypothetical protein PLF13_01620 [candidate division Zixibacteria bacterium]|nr:hypothetical protein [candidate division Zixibacteria bacterium]
MTGKITIAGSIALLLGIILIAGCSVKRVTIRPDQIPEHADKKFVSLVRMADLVGAVVETDTTGGAQTASEEESNLVLVKFDQGSGKIDPNDWSVAGRTGDSSFSRLMENIQYLQFRQINHGTRYMWPDSLKMCMVDTTCDEEMIDPGVNPCWERVKFGRGGGRYDASRDLLTGVSDKDNPIEIAPSDIRIAEYSYFDKMDAARKATLLGALGMLLLGFSQTF